MMLEITDNLRFSPFEFDVKWLKDDRTGGRKGKGDRISERVCIRELQENMEHRGENHRRTKCLSCQN